MNTDKHRWETNQITKVVIGAAYQVANTPGSGFLEKVYENALSLDAIHLAQCLNYLKATGLHVCLLVNFGNPKIEIKRMVL